MHRTQRYAVYRQQEQEGVHCHRLRKVCGHITNTRNNRHRALSPKKHCIENLSTLTVRTESITVRQYSTRRQCNRKHEQTQAGSKVTSSRASCQSTVELAKRRRRRRLLRRINQEGCPDSCPALETVGQRYRGGGEWEDSNTTIQDHRVSPSDNQLLQRLRQHTHTTLFAS